MGPGGACRHGSGTWRRGLSGAAVRRADRKRHSGWRGEDCASSPGREVEMVSADGTRLRALVQGEGDNTVFLSHGWCCNRAVFRHQQDFLRDDYKVVTLEFRGFGRSEPPANGRYEVEWLAEDLKAAVDFFNPGRFVLLGHSMGGFTSLAFFRRYAEEYHGRLKGMVLINSSGLPLDQGIILGGLIERFYPFPLDLILRTGARLGFLIDPFEKMIKNTLPIYMVVRSIGFGRKPPGDAVVLLREMVLGTPITSFLLGAKACIDVRNQDVLPCVDVPVLSIMGSRDVLTSLEVNQKTVSLIPDARLEVHEGAGHCVLLERHQEVDAEIGAFLRQVLVGSERPV